MIRNALRLLLVIALCMPNAQSDAASPRVGFLSPTTPEGTAFVLAGLRQGLRENGFVEGTNITIESRFARDRFDRLPALARELVDLPVDVLVTFVTQASLAAKQTTSKIPIVMIGVSDPVGSGLVASLSRPGGNITGTSGAFSESVGKGLQFLRETVPDLRRIAVVVNPSNAVFQRQVLEETRAAARQLGIELQLFEARDPASIEAAFAAIAKQHVQAVNLLPDPMFAANWVRIAELAAQLRLPSVTVSYIYAEAGGLMAYGPSLAEMARVAGGYVAKILKGASPGELPVERPTKYELVINVRTAKQIGIVVPPSVRLRADRLIE